jgi:hypothetical protein
MGPLIQDDWAMRHLLPSMHLLDGGYVDAELLVTAQTVHQVDVVGPPFGSYSHQRRAGEGDDLGRRFNLVRVAAWLEDTPRATTRRSAFATLAA